MYLNPQMRMRKTLTFLVAFAFYSFAIAQSPKFYLDNSLVFNSAPQQKIPFPFVGGLVSPQFSNIDLNADGVKDLFVFDRGGNKVLTFIRNTGAGADWIYAPQYEFGFPKINSWALLVDYNKDGKEDIFTAANPYYYSQSIMVYKNVSANGVPAFEVAKEVLEYDQNVDGLPLASIYSIDMDIPAILDADGDGDIDILSFDASAASITLYGNEAVDDTLPLDSLRYRAYDFCWGNFRESFIDRSVTLGVECWGGKYYPKKSGVHSGSTMLMLDMDNDNDNDLILGDASYDELTLLINGKTQFSWNSDSMVSYDTVFPAANRAKVYTFPAAFYVDVTNDGVKDLIVAPNMASGGKTLNQVWFYKNNGTNTLPSFALVKQNFIQDNTIDFGSGASPAFLDVDNDGDTDLLVAHRGDYQVTLNAADRINLFLNTGTKTTPVFELQSGNDYLGLIKDSIRDMKPTFGDLTGDGKPDMLIGDADGKLWFYQNNTATSLSFTTPIKNYMKIDVGNAAAPQIIDLDKDGLLDIAVGTSSGIINFFKNKGSVTAANFDSVPTIDTLGGVFVNDWYYYYVPDPNTGEIIDTTVIYDTKGFATPYFSDFDLDGKLDLAVGCYSGKLWMFDSIDGNLNGDFIPNDTFLFNNITKQMGGYSPGMRSAPVVAKLSDSAKAKPIMVIGNFRGGINFLNALEDTSKVQNPIGVREINPELTVSVYPNPANTSVNISRSLQQYEGSVDVTLIDLLGREVYSGVIAEGSSMHTISTAHLQQGIYYIQLNGGLHYKAVQKITILR